MTNVVPFARPRRDAAAGATAPRILVLPSDRPAGMAADGRARWALLLLCSVAAHLALYLPFGREPEPMASIGEVVISTEIVIGANAPAGVAEHGQADVPAPEPARAAEPVEVAEVRPAEQEAARSEDHHTQPAEPQQLAALSEPTEVPAMKLQAPLEPAPEKPQSPAGVQAAPAQTVVPAELPVGSNPAPAGETEQLAPGEAQSLPDAKREAPKAAAKPNPERPRPEARRAPVAGASNQSRSTAPAATAAGGIGRGRSDSSSNYAGLVAAHLRRHLRFPPEARAQGYAGSASVTFALSGSGSVTSVRLGRSTGVGSLDAEATAVVRRASPFPAPPEGRGMSFTVPLSFRLN